MDLLLKLYSIQGFSSGDLSPGITVATTLKYRLEDEVISDYVAQRQAAGDLRLMQEIATEYNDTVIYSDKVWLNSGIIVIIRSGRTSRCFSRPRSASGYGSPGKRCEGSYRLSFLRKFPEECV